MGQTTSVAAASTELSEFYDWVAVDYDSMTGFEQRFLREKPFFRMFVERYAVKTAIDAGSGTGFHSILLAHLGVDVTAVDISARMLERLKARARKMDLRIATVASALQTLDPRKLPCVDAIFCLGNTLAHLPSDELSAVLKTMCGLLKPGGILFLQLLNFDRILARHERLQSVRESGDTTFVRFYDFGEKAIRFNIVKLAKENGTTRQDLKSIILHPIVAEQLLHVLSESGFSDLRCFGGVSMEEFRAKESHDLVVLGTKKPESSKYENPHER